MHLPSDTSARHAAEDEPADDESDVLRQSVLETARRVLVLQRRADEQKEETLRALQEAEEVFRLTFEHAPVGMGICGLDGRWGQVNERLARMLGYTTEELARLRFVDVLHPLDAEVARSVAAALASPAASCETTARCTRKDGTTADVVIHASLLRLPDGSPRSHILQIEDVTEKRKIEAQLVHADRMVSVGTLASGVAHEINNPLTYIMSNVDFVREQLARSDSPESKDLAAMLDSALEGCHRVRTIVQGLRGFGREEPEAPTPVDVRCALEASLGLTDNLLRHRARVVTQIEEGLPTVIADERRLVQVFVNLLVNASDSLPEGRAHSNVITLRARTLPAGRISIEVEDTGSGMTEEVRSRIFEPFFSTKAAGGGTGLGLPISQRIVASLGGSIELESLPGRGSTFRIVLPAGPPAVKPSASTASTGKLPEARRARVAIIDDEERVARALCRVIGGDHECIVLRSGGDLLLRIGAGERFDAIFCDMMMPDMTGAEVLTELKVAAPEQAERFAFVTGGAFTVTAGRALNGSGRPTIRKPFAVDEVRGVLASVLSRPSEEST